MAGPRVGSLRTSSLIVRNDCKAVVLKGARAGGRRRACGRLSPPAVVRKNNFQTLEPMFANSSQTISDVWYS
jgi:hypothetical protein